MEGLGARVAIGPLAATPHSLIVRPLLRVKVTLKCAQVTQKDEDARERREEEEEIGGAPSTSEDRPIGDTISE